MVVPVPHAKPDMTDDMKEGSLCWTTVTGAGVGELTGEADFTGEEDFAGEEDLAGEENLAGEDDLTGDADLTGDLLRGIFLIYTPSFLCRSRQFRQQFSWECRMFNTPCPQSNFYNLMGPLRELVQNIAIGPDQWNTIFL